MVDITPLIRSDSRVIQGYGSGLVRISGTTYKNPVCVTVSSVTEWSGELSDIQFGDDAGPVELVLIGVDKNDSPLPPFVRDQYRARGWAVEIMELGAACRTYNVLMADGRHVGVALKI